MEQKEQNLGMRKRELKHKAFYEERLPDSEKLWKNVYALGPKPFPICAPAYSWEDLKKMAPCTFCDVLEECMRMIKAYRKDIYRRRPGTYDKEYDNPSVEVLIRHFALEYFLVMEHCLLVYYRKFRGEVDSLMEILTVFPEARFFLIIILRNIEGKGLCTDKETEENIIRIRKDLEIERVKEEIHIKRLKDWGFQFRLVEQVNGFGGTWRYQFEKAKMDQAYTERLQRLNDLVNQRAKENGYTRFKSINQLWKQVPHIRETHLRARHYYNRLEFVAASQVLFEEFMGIVDGE